MKYKNKILILSGTLLALCATSSCSTQKMNDMFASERTIPEGSQVTFEQRHPPELNPGGNAVDPMSGAPGRHVPIENNSNNPAPAPISPTSMNDTVAPVQTANIAPMPTASTPDNSTYPTLASVPPVPPHPTQAQNKSDFNTMMADRDATNSESKNLMNDTNATVMTSPQTGQLVTNAETATPQPVVPAQPVVADVTPPPAAPAPVVTKESSDTGFNGWLHSIFGSPDKKPSEMASENAVRKTPVENIEAENAPITVSAPQPVAQQPAVQPISQPVTASSEPLPFAAPTSVAPAAPSVTATAPVAQNTTPAALPSTAQLSEPPVVLHEPTSYGSGATSNEPLPSTSALQDPPINLVPPSGTGTYSNTRYIADSRYAAMRSNAE